LHTHTPLGAFGSEPNASAGSATTA
jgi:hypothetical protein